MNLGIPTTWWVSDAEAVTSGTLAAFTGISPLLTLSAGSDLVKDRAADN